jgi:hypothetical protein
MKTFLALLIIGFVAPSVSAKLGESRLQIENRYGKSYYAGVDQDGMTRCMYRYKNNNVMVTFHQGFCIQESIYLRDKDHPPTVEDYVAFAAAITETKPADSHFSPPIMESIIVYECGEFTLTVTRDPQLFDGTVETKATTRLMKRKADEARAAKSKKIQDDFGK